jgi:hypothetical protein
MAFNRLHLNVPSSAVRGDRDVINKIKERVRVLERNKRAVIQKMEKQGFSRRDVDEAIARLDKKIVEYNEWLEDYGG